MIDDKFGLQYEILEMTVDDIDATTQMKLRSWLDTYPNVEAGITEEWVKERFIPQLSSDTLQARIDRFVAAKANKTFFPFIAKDSAGQIIGTTTPFIEASGVQRVGAIYVDPDWIGKGVGAALMQRVIDSHDPSKPIELNVVPYNERARSFYRKWGFEEIPGSEKIVEDILPEIRMIRKAQNEIQS